MYVLTINLCYNLYMQKIIVLGGSGFVGTFLVNKLLEKNYQVLILDLVPSKINHKNLSFQKINLMNEKINPTLLENSLAIVNLAGIPIFGRFTEKYKKLIYDSRINTTRNIVEAIMQTNIKPKILVNASAIGYYGDQKEILLNEESKNGKDFLAKVCKDWEDEALKIKEYGVNVGIIRTAHVIGKGGLSKVLSNLFKKQIGGYFGNGKQRMPWISISDLVNMYIFIIENNLNGIYNGAVSNPTQKEFMREFQKRYKAFILWHIPSIFGFILYGEFIKALTGGQNIDNTKIKKANFVFQDEDLEILLKEI